MAITKRQERALLALKHAIETDETPAGYVLTEWHVVENEGLRCVVLRATVNKPEGGGGGARWWHVFIGKRGGCFSFTPGGKKVVGVCDCVRAYRWLYHT